MNKKEVLNYLDNGLKLRIKTWPDDFYLQKIDNNYIFSNGEFLKDHSYFEVQDWELYDESKLFFSARCESERLNRLKLFSLEDDIIDL